MLKKLSSVERIVEILRRDGASYSVGALGMTLSCEEAGD